MSTVLAVRETTLAIGEVESLADAFIKSGFFADAKSQSQAIVKIIAGQELGFGPMASMTGVYIVKGKVSLSANLMAAAVKKSGRYNYRVRELTDNAAEIEFFERTGNAWESIGKSRFSADDAKKAGLLGNSTWQQYPRNMLFARAMSNGVKWFTPDIFGGPLYTPEEMGATVNGETGEVIDDDARSVVIDQIIKERGATKEPHAPRPWLPAALGANLLRWADELHDAAPLSSGWKGALIKNLAVGLGGEANRRHFLEVVFNVSSATQLSDGQWGAIKRWIGLTKIEDDGGVQWLPSEHFVQESAAWAAAHPLAEDADLLQAAAANPHSVYATGGES